MSLTNQVGQSRVPLPVCCAMPCPEAAQEGSLPYVRGPPNFPEVTRYSLLGLLNDLSKSGDTSSNTHHLFVHREAQRAHGETPATHSPTKMGFKET